MIDRKKRNEEILNACADVFYEKGIQKATMRNFSEAIGYSPATIYQSFKDKREIVKNCLYFCAEKRNIVINDILSANIDSPKNLINAMAAQKKDIIKWSTIILRIITSPYYDDMKDDVNTLNMTVVDVHANDYENDVLALFNLYYSAIIHYAVNGSDHYLKIQEDYLSRQLENILK